MIFLELRIESTEYKIKICDFSILYEFKTNLLNKPIFRYSLFYSHIVNFHEVIQMYRDALLPNAHFFDNYYDFGISFFKPSSIFDEVKLTLPFFLM